MKSKTVTAILLTLSVASMLLILPVVAGPNKARSDNKIHIPWGTDKELVIIVSKRGWRQWYYGDGDIIHFAVCLYTDGMNQEAIDAHVADGWILHSGLGAGDSRYIYVGGGPFIYKYHYIPAGP